MAQKRTPNERRLTKRQVQELISSGARPRPDLSAALEPTSLQQLVYELEGDRYLVVFGEQGPVRGLRGKGTFMRPTTFAGSCAGWRRSTKTPRMGAKAPSIIGPTILRSNIG